MVFNIDACKGVRGKGEVSFEFFLGEVFSFLANRLESPSKRFAGLEPPSFMLSLGLEPLFKLEKVPLFV